MPIGSSSVFARMAALMEHNRGRIRSVLDLGVGFGANGVAVRQWLDYGVRRPDGKWPTQLVGIEGWGEYRNPVWDIYDAVYVERIEDSTLLSREKWDCILFTDVIEHMPKDLGGYILERIAKALTPNGLAICGTPAVFWPQGAAHGNDLERHVSIWTPLDFSWHGWKVEWDGTPDQWGQRMLMATRGLG